MPLEPCQLQQPPPVLLRLPVRLEPFLPGPLLHLGQAGQEAAGQPGKAVEGGDLGLLQGRLLGGQEQGQAGGQHRNQGGELLLLQVIVPLISPPVPEVEWS